MEGRDVEFEYFVNGFVEQLVGRYGLLRVLEEVEHAMIEKAVKKTMTHVQAAEMLKITRTNLQNKVKIYGIKRELQPGPQKEADPQP